MVADTVTARGSGSARPERARPLLALLDGHSLAYRAYFALPEDLQTTTGQLTNAVYGFTSMLIKLLGERRPDAIAVAFDQGRPVERLNALPEYKGQRAETPDSFRSQLPLVHEVLDALAIPKLSLPDTEADDIIATYARRATEEGWDTLVVTGDRDVFQLIDGTVTVLYTRRGITDTVEMDAEAVRERYGVDPQQYPMLAALRGDPSDNIPGVPGVGDKTAAKLLREFSDLRGVFDNLEQVSGKKLPATLAEYQDIVWNGYEVGQLRRDLDVPAPIGSLRQGTVDVDAVRSLFATLEFRALWERLSEQVLAGHAEREATAFTAHPTQAGPGQLAAWIDARPAGTPVAVVPFTHGHPPRVGFEAVALAGADAQPVSAALAELEDADLVALGRLLGDPDRPLRVHGAKDLLHAADSRGWRVEGVETDTQLAAYLVQPQQRDYDLEGLAEQYLHKELRSDGRGEQEQTAQLTLSLGEDWAERCLRAQAVLDLVDVLGKELAERDQTPLHDTLELPLVPVLAAMERAGIAVDLDVLTEIGHTLEDRIRTLRGEIYELAGEEFNCDSPKQLQAILFDKLDLPKTKRIKTGYSTDAQALSGIAHTHPIVEQLLAYREVSKLKSTYVDALPPLVDPETGRIHAEFSQTVAVTGRLSSQHPNIQNIPIRSATGREIRRAFVPGEGPGRGGPEKPGGGGPEEPGGGGPEEPGGGGPEEPGGGGPEEPGGGGPEEYESLLVADYSQIELRVMAHLSGDESLIEAFTSHEDIHATTAAMVWDLPISAVDTTLRSRIKGMTYGLAYGLSAFGLSQQLGIPPDEARELMDAYLARFPKVRDYLYGGVEAARKDGYTATLFGRRRYLPDLMSDNRQRREMAERMALNAPIQGTAADIIKQAMVAVYDRMRAEGLASQLLLQVHDELVCETAPGEEEALRTLLEEEMAGVADLAVPLEVDTATGASWADAEKH